MFPEVADCGLTEVMVYSVTPSKAALTTSRTFVQPALPFPVIPALSFHAIAPTTASRLVRVMAPLLALVLLVPDAFVASTGLTARMLENSNAWTVYAQVPVAPLDATLMESAVLKAVPIKAWHSATVGLPVAFWKRRSVV